MSKLKSFGLFALVFIVAILAGSSNAYSQKIAFISSDQIRELLPEAKQADNRLQTLVEEWKREIKEIDLKIEAKEFEIEKNRLIWSDPEKDQANMELQSLKDQKKDYAKQKFEAGGEYDQMVKTIMKTVEEKIYAAVQKVAAEEGYDMVWDKSIQPLPYVNFKFDLTVKVLRELGVDVEQLEKDLQKRIDSDPRNQRKKNLITPEGKTRRSRERKTQDIQPNSTTPANNNTTGTSGNTTGTIVKPDSTTSKP